MTTRPEFGSEMFATGVQIRREVLGSDYVDRSLASANDFSAPIQQLVTEYCWGAVWGRPGLERKTRSMLNIAMLSALNRSHERKLHLRGALQNGVTRDEIREIIMQVAIYCGVPACIESSRVAQELFPGTRRGVDDGGRASGWPRRARLRRGTKESSCRTRSGARGISHACRPSPVRYGRGWVTTTPRPVQLPRPGTHLLPAAVDGAGQSLKACSARELLWSSSNAAPRSPLSGLGEACP